MTRHNKSYSAVLRPKVRMAAPLLYNEYNIVHALLHLCIGQGERTANRRCVDPPGPVLTVDCRVSEVRP